MNTILNADLHCHSTYSDGTLSPEALASRAHEQGVDLWALTDHDEIAGQARAAAAAAALGMRCLTGVEISVTFIGRTIHIVGLGFDAAHPELLAGLHRTRHGRTQRAIDMAQGLALVGIEGAYEGALRHVDNPELVSRTHFARFLVEQGHCRDTAEVFRKYLTDDKPGFVPHNWAKLGEAVQWITQAGGVAVIAHPARYKLKANEEYALITEFMAHGGQAIEVVTGSHSAADAQRYAHTALEYGLAASRGSDFHSPTESRTDMGTLPPLAAALTPVWSLLADRIR